MGTPIATLDTHGLFWKKRWELFENHVSHDRSVIGLVRRKESVELASLACKCGVGRLHTCLL